MLKALAVEVQICRVPCANIGIGAAIVAMPPDARVLGRPTATATGIQGRCRVRVVVGGLAEINAVRAEAVVAVTTAAEVLSIGVVTAAVAPFAEMNRVRTTATLKGGVAGAVGEGVEDVNERH